MKHEYQNIIKFWFDEIEPSSWFKKDSNFDRMLLDRFLNVHTAAAQGELWHWRDNAEGRLAEIIVLDQFSRNMFRDSARAFAYDSLGLVLAQEAVHLGVDQKLPVSKRTFMYMPYMHSESKIIHEQAVLLFSQEGMQGNYNFELKHKAIIDRFGRYPHRNDVLQRQSSAEEIEFLKQPGSGF